MNDRELLELAAKAAGYDVVYESTYLTFFRQDVPGRPIWNPLNDDGDALRLAVKLGFLIEVIHGEQMVVVWDCEPANETRKTSVLWGNLTGAEVDNAHAATRRAIVKAAAMVVKIKKKIGGNV